jgi:stage IV sporulation protein FB
MNFTFLNIPVFIQPTFWLFLLIFCFNPQATISQMSLLACVCGLSLLFHEYGHALAAKKLGRDPKITLEDFGGYASYSGYGLTDTHHFVITLCGPLFTGLLIALSYYLLHIRFFTLYEINYFLYCMKELNTYWLIVNLAPLHPLDGGKLTEYLLKKICKEELGHQISLVLGNVVAILGLVYFIFHGNYLFAYLFLFHGWKNFQNTTAYAKKKPTDFQLYNQALQAIEKEEKEKAKGIFKKLYRSKETSIQIRSSEGLAGLLEGEGKQKEAYELLSKVDPHQLTRGKWLLCKLAYSQKNYSLVGKFAREIYDSHPTFETALLNAKTFSQLSDPDYALGWLNTALQFKTEQTISLDSLLKDPAFEPIQNHPQFQKMFELEQV